MKSLRSYSSSNSFTNFPVDSLSNILVHVSSQDINETLYNVDKKNRRLATDLTRKTKFLLTSLIEDQILVVYLRKEAITSTKLVQLPREENFHGSPEWIISVSERMFLASFTLGDCKTLIQEFQPTKGHWQVRKRLKGFLGIWAG